MADVKTTSGVAATDQVSDHQMKCYVDLIYKTTGIRIPLAKKTLMSNRIRRRLKQTGIDEFEAYFKLLKSLKPSDPEWDAFLQEVTTHESYLFRDEAQWEWFRRDYLSELASAARRGDRSQSLRIWSAAASTGDEAHTIASCIAGNLPAYSQWKIQILGTDIGVGALEEAKVGEYGERAMRLVPENFKERYFTKSPDAELWQAKPVLKDMIKIRQHNLMEPLNEPPFDVIFLKNVLIYFDKQSKQTVLSNLCKVMRPGSLLVAGAAEGVADLLREMQRLQPWLYREPESQGTHNE